MRECGKRYRKNLYYMIISDYCKKTAFLGLDSFPEGLGWDVKSGEKGL
jgi:hypothetical protein